jgi:hypothetical protein
VLWIGPSGATELATQTVTSTVDFAIAPQGLGVLVISEGTVHRLDPIIQPAVLQAPTAPAAGGPLPVSVQGRPFSLAPLIVAVDVPNPPFTIPLVGTFHTSLGILSTFVAVEDGVGVFHGPDPADALDASGAWSASYPLPPALSGLTFVAQAYVLDPGAPNLLFWITNPVTIGVL